MAELQRHSRPSDESPEMIVREKEVLEISDEHVGIVRVATIERYVQTGFGGYTHEQTGAGIIERQ